LIEGSIPLDPKLCKSIEDGKTFADGLENSQTLAHINDIVEKILNHQ
jgi:hypothetical protein